MSITGWHHPIDGSDQWDGFNDSGIEHFSGDPIRHLAREVHQNSSDSHDEASGGPVRVVIRKHSVKPDSIPNVEQLRKTFELCEVAAANESEKAKHFFSAALKELNRARISVLEISDYNTRGVEGPAKNGYPYYALMKAKGQSKKPSGTAGGSYGIGKFAPFAVSKLRTVFVSTVFKGEDNRLVQYTQGKSILMSHDDESGERREGVGFWGVVEKCQPVRDQQIDLPAWIVRATKPTDYKKAVGTTLSILGFDDRTGWQEVLAASVIENFFGAIIEGRLEVEIENGYRIDGETIWGLLEDEEIKGALNKQRGEPEQYLNAAEYSRCVRDHAQVFIEQSQMQHLGLCELRIIVGEGLPKRVAFLRNGMFITDELNIPGLKNFSDFKEFAAVFQCKSEKGIALLRAMEPPRHDTFEPDRLQSKDEQDKGRRALKDMASWIREMLKRRAKDPVSEITKLDELRDYFAQEGAEGDGDGQEEVNPFGNVVIKAKRIPPKSSPRSSEHDGDGKGSSEEGGGGGGGSDGSGGGDGEGGEGRAEGGSGAGASRPTATLRNLRAIITGADSRRISFTPQADGEILISLYEVGADSDYTVNVAGANKGNVVKGAIGLKVKKNIRETVDVRLAEEFDGALKVVAHEV